MNDLKLFKGAATAVITPFKNGKVDFEAFERILSMQINAGISALVVCGTTGESATLTDTEWKELISFTVRYAKGRVPVVAGCGSNSTAIAENKAAIAEKLGADALLCVTPYYNKANTEGLIRHFERVAASTSLPLILYNVPSRTGVDISMEVYKALSEVENILAIKEASGSAAKSAEILSYFGNRYYLYSGSDEINLPILSIGGDGVISVLSNLVPQEVVKMCSLAFAENYTEAARLSAKLYPLTKALFCEVNPVPIKTALAEVGLCTAELRLPLGKISEKNKKNLVDTMKSFGIIT